MHLTHFSQFNAHNNSMTEELPSSDNDITDILLAYR